jgi:integrase
MKLFKSIIDKNTYWSVYSDEGIYQDEISAYLIHCIDNIELNEETVRGRVYALQNWADFLLKERKEITSANDSLIKQYRDLLVDKKRENSSNNSKSRQRSINQYLRIIYDFYCWMQLNEIAPYILGPSDIYNIYSELTVDSKVKSEYDKYPLLFRRTSSKSKHRTTYTPDYETFLLLYRYFMSSHSAQISERNCLILKIAFEGGFRVGSTASLTIKDFDEIKLRKCEDYFTVTPMVQKFGRTNSFDISISLAKDILEYINGPRKKLAEQLNSKSDYLFLDTVNGSNLLAKSISSYFSKASKKLGLPYRSGIHSWRGLFTENLIDYEIDARQELGFDTSIESIGMVVSKALGHSNPTSQQNYIRSMKSKHRSSQAFKHKEEVSILRQELLREIKSSELLRKEISELTKNTD